MIEPRLGWPKPLIKIERYLIDKRHESRDYGTYIIHVWEFRYSDGEVERLRRWVRK